MSIAGTNPSDGAKVTNNFGTAKEKDEKIKNWRISFNYQELEK